MFEELNERRKAVECNIAKGFGMDDADLDFEKALEDELEKGRAKKTFAVGDTFTRHGITYKCTGISANTGRPTWSKVKDGEGSKQEQSQKKEDKKDEQPKQEQKENKKEISQLKSKDEYIKAASKALGTYDGSSLYDSGNTEFGRMKIYCRTYFGKREYDVKFITKDGIDVSGKLVMRGNSGTAAKKAVLEYLSEKYVKEDKQKEWQISSKKDALDLDEALKKAKKVKVDQYDYNDTGRTSIMKEMFEAFGLDNKVKVVKSGWGPYIMKFYVDGEEKQGYNIYGRDGKIGDANFASCVCDCIIDELKKRKIKFNEDEINPWIFDLGKPKTH